MQIESDRLQSKQRQAWQKSKVEEKRGWSSQRSVDDGFVLDVLVREKVALRLLSCRVLLLILDCNYTLIFLQKLLFWRIRPIILFVCRQGNKKKQLNGFIQNSVEGWNAPNVDVDKGADGGRFYHLNNTLPLYFLGGKTSHLCNPVSLVSKMIPDEYQRFVLQILLSSSTDLDFPTELHLE